MGMIQWSHKLDFDFIVNELSLLCDLPTEDILARLEGYPKDLQGTNSM